MTKYKTKLNKKQEYNSGATRDAAAGKGRFDLIPNLALARVADVYEKGAKNHGARNWEQGIPSSRMIDSAMRHIQQHMMSKYMPELREEDHLAHSIWNLLGIIHIEEMISRGILPKELDDLPKYGADKVSKQDCSEVDAINNISAEDYEKAVNNAMAKYQLHFDEYIKEQFLADTKYKTETKDCESCGKGCSESNSDEGVSAEDYEKARTKRQLRQDEYIKELGRCNHKICNQDGYCLLCGRRHEGLEKYTGNECPKCKSVNTFCEGNVSEPEFICKNCLNTWFIS